MGSFAASSIFTLAIAFMLPASVYGEIMALQAGVLIISSLLTCRTFDLFFFLTSRHSSDATVAFRYAIGVEFVTGMLMVMLSGAMAVLLHNLDTHAPDVGLFAAYSTLVALGATQGASMALLRFFERWKLIVLADSLCMLTWIAAFASVFFGSVREPIMILLLSGIGPAIRAIGLLCACALLVKQIEKNSLASSVNAKIIYSFVIKGQGINFLKNGTFPTETLIANAFFEPHFVAIYRISRSLISPPTVLLNFFLQKSYNQIIGFKKNENRRLKHRYLGQKWLLLSSFLYLPCAAIAGIYLHFRPEVDVIDFFIVFTVCYVTLLISVYQQSIIAALSVGGEQAVLSHSYLVYFAVLACGAIILSAVPSLTIFVLSILIAAILRAVVIGLGSKI